MNSQVIELRWWHDRYGTIERTSRDRSSHAGLDPETGVLSKDTVIVPETGVSARLYRPTSDPKYHNSLNRLVAEANIFLVSVDYRRAPENPLPAAYDDSWAALQWVAAHAKEDGGSEAWLNDCVDFGRVFLAGDSCGANMAHHFALKLKDCELGHQINIQAIAMIFPYFWGKDPIGVEVTDQARKSMVDNWWLLVCPSEKGCDGSSNQPIRRWIPKSRECCL
ncbi:hypothetical protein POTOM_046175 [Populus tomentosa]|uniref:Alpha/beta hydrolase fold-3 domain-containing protein n=1 Tax=Populus tomentosa TaxID=118781 RepID=A0A8X7YHN4_POPTO|nr:hypothetical protein POTOM_046175 [Populus tomentosa]